LTALKKKLLKDTLWVLRKESSGSSTGSLKRASLVDIRLLDREDMATSET
jgi:hypothetical protein